MGVVLTKGQKLSLTKDNPGLTKVVAGLGWDVNQFDTGQDADLDVEVFMTGADDKCPKEADFIYFGQKVHPSGAVVHSGDNRTGEGEGDDEQVRIDLSKIPEEIQKLYFTVTIYDAEAKRQNFGQIDNAYIRLVNEDTGEELGRYDLGEEFSIETSMIFAQLYRYNGEWKFAAVGSGYTGGLEALCDRFGISFQK